MTNHINKGQSMFEVVIALFIIAMIIVGVVSLSTVSLSNAVFSRNKNLAGRYSQEAIEWLRSERDRDPNLFITHTGVSKYCLNMVPLTQTSWSVSGSCSDKIANTLFKREVTFTQSQIGCPSNCKNIIEASVITSWSDSKGYHEAKSVTNFSDIREK